MIPKEKHFTHFRNNTIGNKLIFKTPYRNKQMIYAGRIASGKLYKPIEGQTAETFGAFVEIWGKDYTYSPMQSFH